MVKQKVYRSPYPTPQVPTNISVPQFLLQSNPDGAPNDKVVMEDFDQSGGSVTYGDLRTRAGLQAMVLKQKYRLTEGDIVGLYGLNTVDWAVLCLAVMWAGCTFCSMNPLATSHELTHYLNLTSPRLIFADAELTERITTAAKNLKPCPSASQPQILPLHSIAKQADQTPTLCKPYNLSGRDNQTVAAGIIFSSGTTSLPKAVLLSHHNLIAQLLSLRATNPFNHNACTREVFFPSFAHIYGIVSGVLLPAWTGGYVNAMRKFEFEAYVRRCSEIKATLMRLVPATAARIADGKGFEGLELGNVRGAMCSGASLPREVIESMRRRLSRDVVVLNGYGLSEGTVSLQREGQADTKAGSVGRVAAGMEVRIVDDDGMDIQGRGGDGECWLRGPSVFIGYLGNEEETRNAFSEDGEGGGRWFRTGDVVRIDEDGDLWLTGRKKELIKYKGNQVAPAELEGILFESDLVADAGVCGLVTKGGTELPAACIVLSEEGIKAGTVKSLKMVEAYLHARVAPYKKLRGGIYAVEALPRGSTGKLLRRQLPRVIVEMQKVKAQL